MGRGGNIIGDEQCASGESYRLEETMRVDRLQHRREIYIFWTTIGANWNSSGAFYHKDHFRTVLDTPRADAYFGRTGCSDGMLRT